MESALYKYAVVSLYKGANTVPKLDTMRRKIHCGLPWWRRFLTRVARKKFIIQGSQFPKIEYWVWVDLVIRYFVFNGILFQSRDVGANWSIAGPAFNPIATRLSLRNGSWKKIRRYNYISVLIMSTVGCNQTCHSSLVLNKELACNVLNCVWEVQTYITRKHIFTILDV